ncbi:MAG: inositol monophosphatase family protein [Candidatus Actinomarina sp.]|jgi:fructose-1,6-bisphosphatase/inositol monophosphatase family enzyme
MDKFIIPFVDEIKNYALDGYYKEFSIRTKPDGSVVTDIDVLVEKKIIKILKKEFPDDSFLGEETGLTKGVNDITWIIDPIDGTRAFSQHKPEWGVLVSRIVKNDISTGIVICPVQDIYTAVHNNELITSSFDYEQIEITNKENIIISCESNLELLGNFKNDNFLFRNRNQFCKDIISIGFSTFDAVITSAPFAHDRLAYEPITKYIGGTVSAIDGKQIPIFEEDVVTLICKSQEVKEVVISKLKSHDNLQEAAS